MLPEDLTEKIFDGQLEWTTDEGSPGMVDFTGSEENRLKSGSAADSYWAMFKDNHVDLIRDCYQKATNE